MNTKIIIAATVAALSLATTAFAAEGNGDPFPFRAHGLTAQVTTQRDTGAAQYPDSMANFSSARLAQETLPENGQNGPVQTAASLPVGAMDGTPAYMEAQVVNRWFAQQADHRFAQTRLVQPHG